MYSDRQADDTLFKLCQRVKGVRGWGKVCGGERVSKTQIQRHRRWFLRAPVTALIMWSSRTRRSVPCTWCIWRRPLLRIVQTSPESPGSGHRCSLSSVGCSRYHRLSWLWTRGRDTQADVHEKKKRKKKGKLIFTNGRRRLREETPHRAPPVATPQSSAADWLGKCHPSIWLQTQWTDLI